MHTKRCFGSSRKQARAVGSQGGGGESEFSFFCSRASQRGISLSSLFSFSIFFHFLDAAARFFPKHASRHCCALPWSPSTSCWPPVTLNEERAPGAMLSAAAGPAAAEERKEEKERREKREEEGAETKPLDRATKICFSRRRRAPLSLRTLLH